MEHIIFPTLKVERNGGQLVVTHQSGMQVTISPKQLENWLLKQLRGSLTAPAADVEGKQA